MTMQFLTWGLVELYETTSDIRILEEAVEICNTMIELFWDDNGGGFYFTGKGNESLITQNKEAYDGAIPSGNSIAAMDLLKLGRLTGSTDFESRADRMLQTFGSTIALAPKIYTQFLHVVDFFTGPSTEIVISGHPDEPAVREMIELVHRSFLPNNVLLRVDKSLENRLASVAPFVKSMIGDDEQPVAYVCKQYTCHTPVKDGEHLRPLLR